MIAKPCQVTKPAAPLILTSVLRAQKHLAEDGGGAGHAAPPLPGCSAMQTSHPRNTDTQIRMNTKQAQAGAAEHARRHVSRKTQS